MKTIEELRAELAIKEKEYILLRDETQDYMERLENLSTQIQYIKNNIDCYEDYAKQALHQECHNSILKWLSGQTEKRYDIGNYNGIVSLRLKLCYFVGENPKGTKEEIFSIMEKYGCSQIDINTSFEHCWNWGNDVTTIKFS
jgi:hypothetical protein